MDPQLEMTFIKALSIKTIKAYQLVSGAVFMPCCRFYPSCSQYAIDAVEKYGIVKGAGKILWRILRCSPLSKGGHDPIR